ncbi:glyoxalase [Mycolicibacterium duvalii]|uniref:VOC family protein n=1 Tax=Mycolicibacterium duvalii TaxID=39688 RepID=UPI000BEEC6EC|nr:VOC family protein [Mycolicibacterium duvalii]MCV7368643.1 VOC family protein [Mycolicibacterium duvalii]PEG39614.1 glyoxalase [Mycolicibacterium duvalii]
MGLRFTELCIDAHDPHAQASWWSRVLGWEAEDTDDADVALRAPDGAGPDWVFLAVPEEKVIKNRLHCDFTPDDQNAEVDRVLALGARRVDIGQGDQTWVVLADPEGNEFCILAAEG